MKEQNEHLSKNLTETRLEKIEIRSQLVDFERDYKKLSKKIDKEVLTKAQLENTISNLEQKILTCQPKKENVNYELWLFYLKLGYIRYKKETVKINNICTDFFDIFKK